MPQLSQPGDTTKECKIPKKCWNEMLKFYGCGKTGHKLAECRRKTQSLSRALTEPENIVENSGTGSLLAPEIKESDLRPPIEECIVDKLLLANGNHLKLVFKVYKQQALEKRRRSPMDIWVNIKLFLP